MASDELRILCIDGGGIRGIIPATILVELEKRLGKPICELFHLIVGTSTGGILAAGLAKKEPLPAETLLNIYLHRGSEIFKKHFFVGAGLYDPKYLANTLLPFVKDDRLSTPHPGNELMMTSLKEGIPFLFKSWKARTEPQLDMPLVDAMVATSSAPAYFPPHEMNWDNAPRKFVDGGVFANNPVICAHAAVQGFEWKGGAPKTVFVLSLGTAQPAWDVDVKWTVDWLPHIIDILMTGPARAAAYQMSRILSPDNYVRLNTVLTFKSPLDDVSESNVARLHKTATDCCQKDWQSDIDKVVQRLTPPKAPLESLGQFNTIPRFAKF